MDQQGLAPGTYRNGREGTRHFSPRQLVSSMTTSHARYARQASHARHCIPRSLPALTNLQRGAANPMLTPFASGQRSPTTRPHTCPTRSVVRKYIVEVSEFTNPWTDSIRPYMSHILGQYVLGAQTLRLLTTTYAPNTLATNGNTIQRCFKFCEEQQLVPLAGKPSTMARFVTLLGNLGTIKASSLQPYLSVVNIFYKDHGREPISLGNLVARVRKGLAA
jgi:hypothetical protein